MTALEDVQPYLRGDEHLVWAGKPDPNKIFSSTDSFVIPFSVVWSAGAFYWEASVLRDDAPIFFKLWGLPFVLFGIYFLLGRFVVKRRRHQQTTYAITDHRALVVTGTSVIDTPMKGRPVTVKWSRNRSHASVMIGGAVGSWSGTMMRMNVGVPMSPQRTYFGVLGLFDVKDPEEMLQALDRARA